MVNILGSYYYLDIDKIDELISHKKNDETIHYEEQEVVENFYDTQENNNFRTVRTILKPNSKTINGPKYEMVKFLLEVIMAEEFETDDSLGMDRAIQDLPVGFKLAINTLLHYQILKEIEE